MEQEEKIGLGVLVPAINCIVEPDVYGAVSPPYTVHFARLPVPTDEATVENLERLEDNLEEAVFSLSQGKVRSIAFACTAGSFIKGPQWDRHLIDRMETVFAPATTTSNSVVAALKELALKKIALVTPYPEPINKLMTSYFTKMGFQITGLKSLFLKHSHDISSVRSQEIFDLAISADSAETEGIVISCTDFPAMPLIETLEEELKKSVVTSNQATLWQLMCLSGTFRPINGYGRLLEKAPQKPAES